MKFSNDKGLMLAARCAVVLFATGGILGVSYAIVMQEQFDVARMLVLLIFTLINARLQTKLFQDSILSFLLPVVLLAIIKEGPFAAVLAGIIVVTAHTVLGWDRMVSRRMAVNGLVTAVAVVASWLAYGALLQNESVKALSLTGTTAFSSLGYFLRIYVPPSWMRSLADGLTAVADWSKPLASAVPSFVTAGLLAFGVVAVSKQRSFVIAMILTAICLGYYCANQLSALAAR
jgi:hypothetical protein